MKKRNKEKNGLHITTQHTGKMEGMQSLSTSCLQNEMCRLRSQEEGSVCQACFAMAMMKHYVQLDPCMRKNGNLLSSRLLSEDEIPKLNVAYFRFESFGDLINDTHCLNYFRICYANPDTHFALWTKNMNIVNRVLQKGYKKPENLNLVWSSLWLNHESDINSWPFIDKVFTVYTEDYIAENDVKINCGDKKCIDCKLCYLKNDVRYINEKLKKR